MRSFHLSILLVLLRSDRILLLLPREISALRVFQSSLPLTHVILQARLLGMSREIMWLQIDFDSFWWRIGTKNWRVLFHSAENQQHLSLTRWITFDPTLRLFPFTEFSLVLLLVRLSRGMGRIRKINIRRRVYWRWLRFTIDPNTELAYWLFLLLKMWTKYEIVTKCAFNL